jgi:hypothetical protein
VCVREREGEGERERETAEREREIFCVNECNCVRVSEKVRESE